MKKWIRRLHLWFGLTIGLIVFIVSITGCLYAFQQEIQDITQDYRFVTPLEKELIPPSELQTIAEKELPGKKIHSVLYSDINRSAIVTFFDFDPEYYYLVYINQYSGDVLKVKNMETDFFHFILDGHFYLWLPPGPGQVIVATSTLIFVLMVMTGLVLWFPKKRSMIRQRFSIKWNSKWRRKNFDLHSVTGFYACFVALIFALTGLVWGFEWFANSYYSTISGGEKLVPWYEPTSGDTIKKEFGSIALIDKIWSETMHNNPSNGNVEVHYPESDTSAIGVSTNPDPGTYWRTDYRYYNRHDLTEIEVTHQYGRFSNATPLADKLMRMNYDIHTGAVFGFTGKLVAFFFSLLIASLPATGFLMWYGRHFKKRVAHHSEQEILQREIIRA